MQSADCILSPMQSADCAGSQIACNNNNINPTKRKFYFTCPLDNIINNDNSYSLIAGIA